MATHAAAVSARDSVCDKFEKDTGLRAAARAVVRVGDDDYGIRISLPSKPTMELPAEILDFPVRYHYPFFTEEPELKASTSLDGED